MALELFALRFKALGMRIGVNHGADGMTIPAATAP